MRSSKTGVAINGRFGGNSDQTRNRISARHGDVPDGAFFRSLSLELEQLGGRFPLWKRILDIAFVVATLPCWLPVMLLIMLFIRLNSPGPIFYRQQRIGYRGKRFMIFKFRTMHVNAETGTHEDYFASLIRSQQPMTKLDRAGDPRLITGARFLRASGLDELPQIFNVLRGEMTLVGPRPCLPNEFEHYERWQQLRVYAPPGLTGHWQVNGKNNTTFNEMIEMDLSYIDKMSLWFDLRIMLRTVPVLASECLEALKRFRSRQISSGRSDQESSQLPQQLNGAGIEK